MMGKVIHIHDHKRSIHHELCGECPKNGISCIDGDDVCLPLEMFVQLCKEKNADIKIEYLENVSVLLDLENSFKGR